jgi:excisionase family DNA binding protein
LLSPHEAAEYLGVHYNTLVRWLSEDRIPGIKIGKRWFINASQLAGHLGDQEAA